MKTLLVATLLAALPGGLSTGDRIGMEDGVAYLGMDAPAQVVPGEPATIEMWFSAEEALGENDWIFMHVDSRKDGARCLAFDRPAPAPQDGIVHHRADLTIPEHCDRGKLDVYVGIYDRTSGARMSPEHSATMDDRIHAGWMSGVHQRTSDARTLFAPSKMKRQRWLVALQPWTWWIVGVLASIGLLAGMLLVRRRWASHVRSMPVLADARPEVQIAILALLVPLLLSVLAALDFVKDDAYISFRYAHNLVTGHGLVFNPGDRLEGFTNFLWTLVLAPFEALGWDLFQVSEILGTLLCFAMLAGVTLLATGIGGARRDASHAWAGLWLATSSSMALWSTSGMEQPLAMLLPVASVLALWRSRGDDRLVAASAVLMALACLTRPEIHLMGLIVGTSLLVDSIVERRIRRDLVIWSVAILVVLVPVHLGRWLYYGSLLPNTYYVKTGASRVLVINGLTKLRDMFSFNMTGLLLVLAPLAFLDRRHLKEKAVILAIALGFMAYVVKVGVDEMRWHRLYLPALPFLVLIGMLGLQSLSDAVAGLLPRRARIAPHVVGWLLVVAAATGNFVYTHSQMTGFNGRGDLSGTYHPDLGKFIVRHERPGGLVAFQDMGSTPYHAPDIAFFDFIGLTEGTVARARHSYGLNAYAATENYKNQEAFDAEMRDYFFEQAPEWTILTVYVPQTQAARVQERFAMSPGPDAMMGHHHNNGYQFGVTKDPRFDENYVHVRTWPRSATYYLMLYRRKDLWEKTPREVVLDAPPGDLSGPTARFDHGLELIGASVETEALERHEAFITTWWKLPGPLDPDVLFFIHVDAEGYRATLDHPPGDWMYPADRWQEGQILEDRVLFQVPVGMQPGSYEVYIGVYRRSTSERFTILEGPDDGTGRIHLGTLTITKLVPFLHQTIPPTDVDEQRKYPDRIIDSGR